MEKIRLLLVEDENVLALVIKETLETRGFEVKVAANGVEGWSMYNLNKPDICIVDIMMPRKDGLSLVADIREVDSNTPIILLTARTQTEDVLKGLEIGADDYMKKPFSMEELILRVKSLTRRSIRGNTDMSSKENATATIGRYSLNYTRLELSYDNIIINLSQREADLLKMLLENKNELLNRRTALLKIWGDDSLFHSRTMDVYITRLRKYLQQDAVVQILNVRGQGYKLVD
ncbi:response regulator transcription factor [Pedobacter caeni]|uniref:DNA-binding response regulator, OmpR family, contains REC and winged-helix (WHTH) domain n=1 Tax=Pedobacter caeni TaxID=288992 RepID=A0A1M5BNE6_9SPHI|nr:response regulator transcription factor [Pedobacter caeni]SHF43906.1 DNA-binding response regulator, OmpR family, contains REC and winged-helix (wHTH) domain [Pedobacter caeni]